MISNGTSMSEFAKLSSDNCSSKAIPIDIVRTVDRNLS